MEKISDKIIDAENEMFKGAKKFCDVFNEIGSIALKNMLSIEMEKLFIKYENGIYTPDKILIRKHIDKLIQDKML